MALLDRGADWFVDAAAGLAHRTRLPLVLVGLFTVGVEWEELAVVTVALVDGRPALAFGAVVGAAIANLTVVLAAGAYLRPISAGRHERRLVLILFVGTLLLTLLASAGRLGGREGVVLLAAYAGYLVWLIVQLGAGWGAVPGGEAEEAEEGALPGIHLVAAIVAGLVLAIAGGELAVRGALRLADGLGLSETVVGLTVVALGTSLPDAVVTVTATRRGATGLVLANAAGSNLCNLLLLVGLVAAVSSVEVPATVVAFDLPLLLSATALLVWASMRRRAGRGFAVVLVVLYVGYLMVRVV